MKTKDLIAALQEADPTGEIECCVDNIDIHFVSQEPAYWDGSLQTLIRDPLNKFYNIIGAKFVRRGNKVQIHTLSIEDAILNDPEMPVDCSEDRHGFDVAGVEHWRKEAKDAIAKADAWFAEREKAKENEKSQ